MKKGMYYFTFVCVILLVSAVIAEATVITSAPYTITKKGYYKINKNLWSSGHGITVNANDVTIDLNGYTISGNGTGDHYGIYMNGRFNVEIRNGTIRNFGSHGIYEESDSGHSHRVINVRVMDNKGYGIFLHSSSNMVKDCTASNNGNSGINISYGSTASGNSAYNNGLSGIAGIGCTMIGNTAYDNGWSGISANSGSTVKNNTAYRNGWHGIALTHHDLVDGNTAYDNNQSGESYTNISSCGQCTFGVNHAP